MSVPTAPGCTDVYVVDTHLFGMPGVMSAYLVDGERTALVDAGAASAAPHVLDALATLSVDPADLEYIVPTHVHLDHAGAVGALARACPNATVSAHERALPYLTEAAERDRLVDSARRALGEMATLYGEPELVQAARCRPLSGGDHLDLGDRTLRVLDAPGHAPHQVALFDDATDALFSADAAGMAIADELHPTTPPPDFDLEASLETLDRLTSLDPAVVCYGHFGGRTDGAAALDAYRSLLVRWVDAVEAARREYGDDRDAIVASLSTEWSMPTLNRDVMGVLRWLDE